MHERPQARAITVRVERAHDRPRPIAQYGAHCLNGGHHRRDAAKRQARRNEADDLAVFDAGVPADDLDGIEGRVGNVERGVERVE